MPKGKKIATIKATSTNGNITDVLKQLWQVAVNLRGLSGHSGRRKIVINER
jgi:hypothetical protein